ncbi:MAG: hypothetical protein QOH49_3895 [Acidobacteriota bacterium]|jgi:hypothetical protein|nr:hypothetical protein [Acidobacteriota bacterium]
MRNKHTGLIKLLFLCAAVPAFASVVSAQVPITDPAPGQLIISEFRLRGPDGASDEFVEVYNTTGSTIRVVDQSRDAAYQLQCALANSCGWALTDLSNIVGGSPKFIIPNGAEIPPRGHYLIANAGGYSLGGYGTPDGTYGAGGGTDIADGTGIAIFKTASNAAFNGSNACLGGTGGATCVLDGVGFGNNAAPYREGAGLTEVLGADVEYSYVRKVGTTGFPQDTNVNANDFWLVATDPSALSGVTAVLGAPGPESLTSPVNSTSQMKSSLLNPDSSSTSLPNQVRVTTSGEAGTPTAFGTLTLRRVFTNTTGGAVTRVRLRITNITTTNSPGAGSAQADVRALTSAAESITVNGVDVDVRKLTLEEPPTQSKGGGYNASLLFDLPGGALADQGSVAVNITLGVAKGGTYRLAYIVEAAP